MQGHSPQLQPQLLPHSPSGHRGRWGHLGDTGRNLKKENRAKAFRSSNPAHEPPAAAAAPEPAPAIWAARAGLSIPGLGLAAQLQHGSRGQALGKLHTIPIPSSARHTNPLTLGVVLRIKPLPAALVVAQQCHSSGILAVSFTPSTEIASVLSLSGSLLVSSPPAVGRRLCLSLEAAVGGSR